jgi:hypothetical protein
MRRFRLALKPVQEVMRANLFGSDVGPPNRPWPCSNLRRCPASAGWRRSGMRYPRILASPPIGHRRAKGRTIAAWDVAILGLGLGPGSPHIVFFRLISVLGAPGEEFPKSGGVQQEVQLFHDQVFGVFLILLGTAGIRRRYIAGPAKIGERESATRQRKAFISPGKMNLP